MKKILTMTCILISGLLLTGCNFKKAPSNAIIKVNNSYITKSQYDTAFDNNVKHSALSQIGIDLRKSPDNYIHISIKQRVVNELIIKALLEQEVKKRKITVSQEEIEKEYANLVDKIGSKEKFNELLKQSQISQSTLKNDIKEGLKVQKLVDTLGVVNISDKDVEKYYKDNIKLFQYPEKVKASHILISVDPVQIKDVLLAKGENKKLSKEEIEKKVNEEIELRHKKAEAILAELKQDPTKFAQLAKENSEDTISAADGGNLGFVAKEELQPDFAKVVFSQKPNTISELVTTPYGYHIIMVTDRKKAGVEPFEKVKFDIKNYLEQQSKADLLQKFLDNVKSNAKIEYIDESYNLDELAKKLKEYEQKNPSLMDSQSASE